MVLIISKFKPGILFLVKSCIFSVYYSCWRILKYHRPLPFPSHRNTLSFLLNARAQKYCTMFNASPAGRDGGTSPILQLPSPIITRRTRTLSTSAKAMNNPEETGKVKYFCRARGHGFITPENGSEDVFVHISDIEDEYVPLPGDEVKYRLCPIPPKFEKNQAVHVRIVNLTPQVHLKWSTPDPETTSSPHK